MYVRRSGSVMEVWAPAKLNLFLEVRAKRSDGFHEIVTLMTAVTIFDTLWFVPEQRRQLDLSCGWAAPLRNEQRVRTPLRQGAALGDLPEGADNIVIRALRLLRERAGILAGARVRLVKRIPSAAGLGGASSDAAAALVAANRAWQLGWSRERLGRVAADLGSDVPFFLRPTAAVCRGRGERVDPVPGLGKMHFVVVRPPGGLSTPEVYRHCRPADKEIPIGPLLAALRRGDIARAGLMLVNRLQETAESLSPWIGRLRREFDDTDCVAHQMSGSGTGYFGICRSARHARRVVARLQTRNVGCVYRAENIGVGDPCGAPSATKE
jgi:4-diphosphocytidyl-2-C-methyl-D-erythritol kinase